MKTILDATTSQSESVNDLIIYGMRDLLPRTATDAEFVAARTLVVNVTKQNTDDLLQLPFAAAAEAKCEQEARVIVLVKYHELRRRGMNVKHKTREIPSPSFDFSPSSSETLEQLKQKLSES